jgi:arylsulfatase
MAPAGTVTLFANDERIGGGRMDHTVPAFFTGYAGLDIGRDNGEVVDARYEKQAPFAFTGTIHKVTYDIRSPSKPDHEALHQTQTAEGQARHIEA